MCRRASPEVTCFLSVVVYVTRQEILQSEPRMHHETQDHPRVSCKLEGLFVLRSCPQTVVNKQILLSISIRHVTSID
jgi:hypothetical protein